MEYTINNDIISLTVSSRGGEPQSVKSADGVDYLWLGSTDYWPGKGPWLFPFIGRLFEERYMYGGVSYPLSIHGFLRASEMELASLGKDFVTLRLDSNEQTLACYPFRFRLTMSYKLVNNSVRIGIDVINQDDKTMLFAIGGHAGYNVPLEKGLKFEDYYLEFSEAAAPKRAEPRPTNLMNGNFIDYPLKDGRIIELRHDLFDNDAVILKDAPRSVTLKSDKGSRAVRVDYPDCEYIAFWHTVRKEAPFICVEPWTALPGCEGEVQELEKHKDMISLAPGATYRHECAITII